MWGCASFHLVLSYTPGEKYTRPRLSPWDSDELQQASDGTTKEDTEGSESRTDSSSQEGSYPEDHACLYEAASAREEGMIAHKDFTVLNSEIMLNPPDGLNGGVGVQYESGAGTLVLEGRVHDTFTWIAILLTSYVDGTTTLAIAAAGMYYANVIGLDAIRLRKSVGAAQLIAAMNYQPG